MTLDFISHVALILHFIKHHVKLSVDVYFCKPDPFPLTLQHRWSAYFLILMFDCHAFPFDFKCLPEIIPTVNICKRTVSLDKFPVLKYMVPLYSTEKAMLQNPNHSTEFCSSFCWWSLHSTWQSTCFSPLILTSFFFIMVCLSSPQVLWVSGGKLQCKLGI